MRRCKIVTVGQDTLALEAAMEYLAPAQVSLIKSAPGDWRGEWQEMRKLSRSRYFKTRGKTKGEAKEHQGQNKGV